MRVRFVTAAVTRASVGAVFGAMQIPVAGQAALGPAAKAPVMAGLRTADGHPDLQGTYDVATLKPLDLRSAGLAQRTPV